MPNHVRNILSFTCDDERKKEILAHIQNDELGPGSIDFNKILPMPESLDMPSGSMEDSAIGIYLTALNPATPDLGRQKLPLHVFIDVARKLNAGKFYGSYDTAVSEDGVKQAIQMERYADENRDKPDAELLATIIGIGEQYVHNALMYGSTTWYGWCNKNWGTKWNAYDAIVDEDALTFHTAWARPEPVIDTLARIFPDARVRYVWADEDLGQNVGAAEYEGGEVVALSLPAPGSREAYELAANVWEYDLAELGYVLTEDGGYEYKEAHDEQPDEAPGMEMQLE